MNFVKTKTWFYCDYQKKIFLVEQKHNLYNIFLPKRSVTVVQVFLEHHSMLTPHLKLCKAMPKLCCLSLCLFS